MASKRPAAAIGDGADHAALQLVPAAAASASAADVALVVNSESAVFGISLHSSREPIKKKEGPRWGLEGPRLAVIAPNGPYEMRKTLSGVLP